MPGQEYARPPCRSDPVKVLGDCGERELRKGRFLRGRRAEACEGRAIPCEGSATRSAPRPGCASPARCRPVPRGCASAGREAELRSATRAGNVPRAEAAARTDGSRGRGKEPGGAAGPGSRPGGREGGRAAGSSRWGAPARGRPRGAAILSVAASGCGEAAGGPGCAGHGAGATGSGSDLTAHGLWKAELFRERSALHY